MGSYANTKSVEELIKDGWKCEYKPVYEPSGQYAYHWSKTYGAYINNCTKVTMVHTNFDELLVKVLIFHKRMIEEFEQ